MNFERSPANSFLQATDCPMGYILSRKAEEDIIDIFLEGAERFGVRHAEHYHQQIEKSFRFLADNPRATRQRPEIIPSVRSIPSNHI